MPAASVKRIEHALDSSNMPTQATVLASPLRTSYLKQRHPMLPAGVTVTLKPHTFKVEHTTAVVQATTSNGHLFTLYLVADSGTWDILYTQEG
jgi:hypothetical protein